ncbi:NAD(P)-binding protein [Macroventuria anomochaeta]|uniref:NAD(P)-binding protein n=1 Tax=Macroventuria anomochaeta TaxID=301207 RepID=A0ACB6RV63_9PLEO|nr:NAD(P)-binding protein [Macroventuria anomochaeta]KAF2625860.1 NAD(P)-binding protein [Macroventuria anomochaeta]
MASSKAPKTVKTVGYIGLGNAGFSMASNLPKNGFNVVVHDMDTEKVQKAAKEWKSTTVSDDKGIEKAFRPGTTIKDTSSSYPFDTQSLCRELAAHELILVDAPIIQTYMHAANAGESPLTVGAGSDEIFEAVKPVLSATAGYLFHMGPLGLGHAMKTLNNYIMEFSICTLNDSLMTGQKWGLDPQKMIDVLNVGTGDLGITQDFMQHSEFRTELPGLLRGYLGDALEQVDPRVDHTELLRGRERRAGLRSRRRRKISNQSDESVRDTDVRPKRDGR